jgi:protease-4
MRPILLCLLASALCALPGRAAAQAPPGPGPGIEAAPTRAVAQPGAGPADGPSPFAVAINPASLGELRGFTLGLRHTEAPHDAPWGGRGTGLYLAAPLPYLSRVQVGAGLELLRPTASVPVGPSGLAGRLSLAASALALGPLSVGLLYAHLFSPGSPYDNVDTVSVGLRLRAGPWFAAGVVFHDLNAPRPIPLPGEPAVPALQRVYEADLLARPLRDDRLEVALGLRVGEQAGDLEPRARLWFRPLRGLAIGADAAVLLGADAAAPDFRVGAGLAVDLAHVGASAFGLLRASSASGAGFGGASAAVRASVEAYPALPTARGAAGRLLKIEPGRLEGVPFLQMLALLREVERDPTWGGVVAVLGDLKVGWGRADELRAAFLRLRRAGKHVFVYGAELSTRAYYVATAAERVFVDPVGGVRVSGAATSTWFVKDALDALGVRADLLRIGDYKSAPETFTRAEPSPQAQAQREALLNLRHQRLVQAVAEGRRLPAARAQAAVDRGLFTPAAARAAGLIDQVATGEEVEDVLRRDLGAALRISGPPGAPKRWRSFSPRAVAVIHIEGDITEGTSRSVPLLDIKMVGGETISRALTEAAAERRVAAIVLRIESPGGSAPVSDLLARQIARIARDKPVLCSMGDTAASGGYYLAAPCTEIFANPSTITGSIGVFGGKVEAGELARRLGVRRVTLSRGPHADMDSNFRPYSAEERALVMEGLQATYQRFLHVVETGRRLPRQAVEAAAQGQIWSGAQAVRLRLCDHEGGFIEALEAARRHAGLPEGEEVELSFYPRKEPGLLQQLLSLLDLGLPLGASLPGARELRPLVFGLPVALLLLESRVLARLPVDITP